MSRPENVNRDDIEGSNASRSYEEMIRSTTRDGNQRIQISSQTSQTRESPSSRIEETSKPFLSNLESREQEDAKNKQTRALDVKVAMVNLSCRIYNCGAMPNRSR